MTQYTVTGMSCAACSARIEKAVKQVPGVTSCSVSLLTNSMGVEGTADTAAVMAAVAAAGYGASPKGKKVNSAPADDSLTDHETPLLKRRLLTSLIFLLVLMYISMGHVMWNWPLPPFLSENHIAMGLTQLLLTVIIMVINQKFFINGFKSLWHLSPNMDTLVALGSAAAFLYSTYALFAMSEAVRIGNTTEAMHYMHEFYFESAAMILTLITVGKMLETRSKGRTTDALRSLMKLAPPTATLWQDGTEQVVPIEQVQVGHIFTVRPGETIPVDGQIIEGNTAVNEATLTGESLPVDKGIGDSVSAATLNQSGYIRCRAQRVGEDTTLSQIIQMVSDAAATKAPIAKAADRVSGIFVPVVIGIALLTAAVWLLVGQSVGFAVARAVSVLVISCPCALGLATPVAIMVGSGVGARHNILFKTAASLEEAGKVKTVVLDKTGTITTGEPQVTDLLSSSVTPDTLLRLAYALEQKSEHPLARAICRKGESAGLSPDQVSDFQALPGRGLSAVFENTILRGGNQTFISENTVIPETTLTQADALAREGKTPLFFSQDHTFIGVIAVADTIKEDSPQAIADMKKLGLRVVMLTGDTEQTARAIGRLAGVDEVIADVRPDGKEATIRSLQVQGKVAMVGDGINDAPALTRADTGIAIGAGTDVALDAADVILMKSSLMDVPAAIRLSRATLRNIHENLFWAFFYNILGIPLAAGIWISLLGWQLNPMFAAAAMSLSSFCVVTNALRLNLLKLPSSSKKIENIAYEVKEMNKTMKIEGMMCGHCEASVKKALEALPEVSLAVVSHTEGTAEVTLRAELSDDVLKKAVTDLDYTVLDIQ